MWRSLLPARNNLGRIRMASPLPRSGLGEGPGVRVFVLLLLRLKRHGGQTIAIIQIGNRIIAPCIAHRDGVAQNRQINHDSFAFDLRVGPVPFAVFVLQGKAAQWRAIFGA